MPGTQTGSGDAAGRVSPAIGIARVLCILGIVYVHAWTGRTGEELAALSASGQGILRWTLIELVGRSAVPLLGMISGWLVAGSLARRGYAAFLAGKARALLLPMLLWNMLSILLVSGAAWLGWIAAPLPTAGWWLVDELLCLAGPNDINVQIAFLRDLFVCMALAPFLLRLGDRGLLVAMALVAVWTIGAWQFYLMLRPQILLFFLAGILARRRGWAARAGAIGPWRAALPFCCILPVKIALSIGGAALGGGHVHLMAALDLLLRVAAALLVWRSALALAGSRFGAPLLSIERYAFLMFCCHLILIWLCGPAIGLVTGPLGAAGYPPFLLVQPLLVLAASIALGRALLAVAPVAAGILSGGRLAYSGASARKARRESMA